MSVAHRCRWDVNCASAMVGLSNEEDGSQKVFCNKRPSSVHFDLDCHWITTTKKPVVVLSSVGVSVGVRIEFAFFRGGL